jgi:cytochrome b561
MALSNSSARWGAVAQVFHWVIVWALLAQFVLASAAEELPAGVGKLATLARHKSIGITILLLAVLRLAWRWSQRAHSPALPADLKRYERVLAQLIHPGLYGLLFALPLSGWLMSSAKHYTVSWFGWFTLPDLVAPDESLFELLKGTHELLANALLVLAALHVAAALMHHFVRKDTVLTRMLPFGGQAGARAGVMLLAVLLGAWGLWQMLPSQATSGSERATSIAPVSATDVAAGAGSSPTAWVSDAQQGSLEFEFVQAGAATRGRFGQFAADIDFTPGAAPSGRFDVRIAVSSIDTQDKERNGQLLTAGLFDVARFAEARYVATAFTANAGGYSAQGQLSLRGITREVPLQFTYTPAAADGKRGPVLAGSATLKRLDFGVGEGEWKSTEWIADEVKVLFNLPLQAHQ